MCKISHPKNKPRNKMRMHRCGKGQFFSTIVSDCLLKSRKLKPIKLILFFSCILDLIKLIFVSMKTFDFDLISYETINSTIEYKTIKTSSTISSHNLIIFLKLEIVYLMSRMLKIPDVISFVRLVYVTQ